MTLHWGWVSVLITFNVLNKAAQYKEETFFFLSACILQFFFFNIVYFLFMARNTFKVKENI